MDKNELIKELVESAEEIEDVRAGGTGGKWDYDALAEALKAMFPGKPGSRKVKVEPVLKFHSSGELKYKARYAKEAIKKAAKKLGWDVPKIRSYTENGVQYIEFKVDF